MAKSIESLVEKEIQKGSTPLKLDSVMVPAEGFRDIDNRERLRNCIKIKYPLFKEMSSLFIYNML